jgi:hypothetical protein
LGRRSRKRARGEPTAVPAPRRSAEERNAEARARLEPLAEGERPRAVTVAAIVAALAAPANLLSGFAVDFGPYDRSAVTFAVLQTVVLVVAAIGMWRVRYWAVLGFQALLAIQILLLALALTRVQSLWVGLGFAALIGLLGLLFWTLVRALARIQMPERPVRQR